MWEGFRERKISFRLSCKYLPLAYDPPDGILKGGAYGSQEKGQEKSQKEKEVVSLRCGVVVVY